ncbi:MAG: histidine phosphatase family protein [Dehalococcoidia bacterium]
MHLILVRHGESLGNASGVLQGRLDYALSDRGIQQAELTAGRLATSGAVRILSSPLTRASATAAFIASSLKIDLRLEPDLAEYDIGEAAGLTGPELRTKFPEILTSRAAGRRFKYPGEEGRDNFDARLNRAMESFRELEGTTIAVAHGGVISAFCHLVVGLDLDRPGAFQVGNCSITEIVEDRTGRLVLSRHNDMCHLEGIETMIDRG